MNTRYCSGLKKEKKFYTFVIQKSLNKKKVPQRNYIK